ncbi:MAG TPA: phage major capsid protein, partial [Candidatus Paceibacterota bacterium]
MVVDIGTMAAPTSIATAANITDFSISAKTITIDTSVTVTGANFVFRSGNALASSVSNEMTGLNQLVSTAANTVGGIDSTAAGNSYWDNQRTNQAGALSLDALTKAFNSVQVAGGNPSLVLGSPGAQRALFNLLQPQVRYVEPMNLKGGFKAIEYMGQPFVADRLAPFGKIYILDERFVKVFSPGDWHFLDEDGNTLKWVVGFDAWEAVLARYINMGTSRRNTNHVIYGLTDDPAGI